MSLSYDGPDPLDHFTAPPPNETSEQRAARIRKEQAAVQRSKQIDAELKAAKAAMKRYSRAVKVLVLGQSMSGKSTTIKNFQITYAKKAWSEERSSWKAVILLNLVRSVNIVVDILSEELSDEDENFNETGSRSRSSTPSPARLRPSEKHRNVMLRLAPLRQIEGDLKAYLGAGSTELDEASAKRVIDPQMQINKPGALQEFTVRSSSGWKSVLDKIRQPQANKEAQAYTVASYVVATYREEIKWLWNDELTQEILQERRVRLEDTPGFFLHDIDRITGTNYEPSDEDIVRARLRTTGVQEHCFTLDRGEHLSCHVELQHGKFNYTANLTDPIDWIMYDVAGVRTQRAAWIPYFREITALIFLAPVSGFNERLEEDRKVNRLEDTLMMWKTICRSKLLFNVQIILFLNKTDLLRRKLDQGIRVQKYIPEYKLGNDYESVSQWFRKVFWRMYDDAGRTKTGLPFISHFTSVIDTKATAQTLEAVQIAILRNDIQEAGLV